MARISVWFVRASLVHFAVGSTAGAWRLASTNGVLPLPPLPLRPLHVEGMLLGWVCQLALGVALWILPFSRSVSADRRLWIAWAALNGGIAGAITGQWLALPTLVVAGRGAEVVAGLLGAWVLWPRIRALPRPSHD